MSDIRLDARVVLFDCDGVLVDSDASVHRAWTRWADRYGLDPEQVAGSVHGRRSADSVEALIEAAQRSDALADINAFELEDASVVTAIPGARDLVASIPDGSWAVVTSGNRALAPARLAAAGIAIPAVLVTADDVEHGKPAPDGYLAAAAALGVPVEEAVVIEDSLDGIRSGLRAGARYVVGVGSRALDSDADLVVADLRSICWDDGLVVEQALSRPQPGRSEPGTPPAT